MASGSVKRVLGARGEDASSLEAEAAGGWSWPPAGDLSSSDWAGLGGSEACMSCSSLATTSITSALSATASRPMAPSTRSTEPRAGLAGAGGGAEGEEWAELWPEPELGEGVSRVTETAASSAGRSAVMMEDTARRLGGRLNKDIVNNLSFIY